MSRIYEHLSPEISERIIHDREAGTRPNFATKSADAIRRDNLADRESAWRTAYIRDVDKIMHSPYYNRYTDKTQVFSFIKNDGYMVMFEFLGFDKSTVKTLILSAI